MIQERKRNNLIDTQMMYQVVNFYVNHKLLWIDCRYEDDPRATENQIVELVVKIENNLFEFAPEETELLDYVEEMYNYLPEN